MTPELGDGWQRVASMRSAAIMGRDNPDLVAMVRKRRRFMAKGEGVRVEN